MITYVNEYFWTTNNTSQSYKITQDLMDIILPSAAQTAPGLLDLFREYLVILSK